MILLPKKYQTDIKQLQEQHIVDKKEIEMMKNTIDDLKEQLSKTHDCYDKLSLTVVKRPVNSTKNIQINNFIQKMERAM